MSEKRDLTGSLEGLRVSIALGDGEPEFKRELLAHWVTLVNHERSKSHG